ncbi:hypothetical protein MRX96_020299 [Rhipicephalus microplus]
MLASLFELGQTVAAEGASFDGSLHEVEYYIRNASMRRHVDQLRAWLTSSTPEKNPSATSTSPAETRPASDTGEASLATIDSSPVTFQSPVLTRATRAPEAVPNLLRRSTRTRHPPERLGF